MSRVDLAKFERAVQSMPAAADRTVASYVIAELEDAREVVKAGQAQWGPHGPCGNLFCGALAEYERKWLR